MSFGGSGGQSARPQPSHHNHQRRSPRDFHVRQQSPHPVDVIRGQQQQQQQAAASVTDIVLMSQQKKDRKTRNTSATTVVTSFNSPPPPPFQQPSPNINDSRVISKCESDDTIPNFTLSDNLESTESAQELRHLIDAMKIEFLRLRNAKIQAEDRAVRLQSDLILQQQKSEKMAVLLHTENEHLKAVAKASDKKLEQAMKTIHELHNEIRLLKGKKERRESYDKDRVSGSHEKVAKNNA
ncbi:hypothetical protein ACHAWU_009663 [Discostella pseudostelligera]|uniref:Uncharacterized protein n=1 Tax=Discostella pseudostelligera TaxID=259834 RepID=A0ABD3N6V1_9STRA